ncbi:YqzL family protein [Paenibacillaceae bacterium]|nr:YqzL family protein [Paenibacillaceae bacterium]
MRNFSWNYFLNTGSIESFLLYKEMNQIGVEEVVAVGMGTTAVDPSDGSGELSSEGTV